MIISTRTALKTIATAAVAGVLGVGAALPAAAQTPSYATSGDEQIRGTIASIDGQYRIAVRDQRGFIDHVSLHQGTIINPTGLELAPGQSVTILGQNQGSTFAANEIDTPYTAYAPVPVYPYGYGYGFGYGYRDGFGYPGFYGGPAYRIGVNVGRGFGFGFRGY